MTADEQQEAIGAGQEVRPVLVVRGGAGGVSIAGLRELVQFREVLRALLVRQVKVRYKQAAIGIGWALVQPVAAAVLFAVVLGRLNHVPSDGVPYLPFALAGMVCWTYFAAAASQSMESLVVDQGLLRKVYFPREILPIAGVLASLVDLAPGLLAVVVVDALYGIWPNLHWLLLPLPALVLVLAALALGLCFSALNVYYRDIRYALPFLLQIGLFASPVVYPLSVIPARWRTLYAIVNPVAAAIDGFRRILLHDAMPRLSVLFGALAWTIVASTGSYAIFKRLERGFSDRV
jgi:lipopolysaccharide transport system permease protein